MGMVSCLDRVAMSTGPSPYRFPSASIAFKPYCVRFEIVLIVRCAYCIWQNSIAKQVCGHS